MRKCCTDISHYLSVELNLAELLKMRASFNATAAKSKKGVSAELSVQDFLVKASCSRCLTPTGHGTTAIDIIFYLSVVM